MAERGREIPGHRRRLGACEQIKLEHDHAELGLTLLLFCYVLLSGYRAFTAAAKFHIRLAGERTFPAGGAIRAWNLKGLLTL